jgi:ribonuclease HI
MEILIYTDGSCVDQIGGFGIIIISSSSNSSSPSDLPYYGRVPYHPCTNNIAELFAIAQAIRLIPEGNQPIVIRTDSAYSIGCLTQWFPNWRRNGWKTSKGTPVENRELIEGIHGLIGNRSIRFEHVRAHQNDYYNNWADQLANMGRSVPPD